MDCGNDPEIEKARCGDSDAFRVLVERHATVVFRLAWRMTGSEADAQDVVQETFLRAWKELHRFDGRAALSTWLHRICANCAIDWLRAKQRRQPADAGPLERFAAAEPSPERLAQSSQVAAMLLPALDELSEMERAAFVMRHYEGMPIEAIARALGVEAGSAKHSVFRAVRKLRRVLEPAVGIGAAGL